MTCRNCQEGGHPSFCSPSCRGDPTTDQIEYGRTRCRDGLHVVAVQEGGGDVRTTSCECGATSYTSVPREASFPKPEERPSPYSVEVTLQTLCGCTKKLIEPEFNGAKFYMLKTGFKQERLFRLRSHKQENGRTVSMLYVEQEPPADSTPDALSRRLRAAQDEIAELGELKRRLEVQLADAVEVTYDRPTTDTQLKRIADVLTNPDSYLMRALTGRGEGDAEAAESDLGSLSEEQISGIDENIENGNTAPVPAGMVHRLALAYYEQRALLARLRGETDALKGETDALKGQIASDGKVIATLHARTPTPTVNEALEAKVKLLTLQLKGATATIEAMTKEASDDAHEIARLRGVAE